MDKEIRLFFRQLAVETGLVKDVEKARWLSFAKGDRSRLDELENVHGYDLVKVARSIANCNYKKRKRVKSKMADIVIDGDCLFLTLTFTDEVLKKTSEATRRRYVVRYLKSQSAVYVANIDFGSKNDREHYHALVKANKVDYSPWHHYGAIKGEKVVSTGASAERLSRYIVKLTNHAIKETAGQGRRIIYSRKVLL